MLVLATAMAQAVQVAVQGCLRAARPNAVREAQHICVVVRDRSAAVCRPVVVVCVSRGRLQHQAAPVVVYACKGLADVLAAM